MLGNLPGASSMHKRAMMSRDYTDLSDVEYDEELEKSSSEQETTKPPWKKSLPHVLVATIVSFLFGYHLGVVNEPLENISIDLGFNGNTLEEVLCLLVHFLDACSVVGLLMKLGAVGHFSCVHCLCFATAKSLMGMLLGRFLVGTGLGVGPSVASLYVAEISPAHVRGTYGSFIQIATCFGLMGALVIGIPVKSILGWWRICFWVSAVPAAMLAILMMFCAESPPWLYKKGRIAEAESELERLLGSPHVAAAMIELSKTDSGDEINAVKLSDLLFGRHSRVVFIGSTLFALQQLSGINAVFYFSSTVFRRAGVSSNLANVFVGISNFIGSFVALALMDKLGRKILLLLSFFGMAIAMALQVIAAALFTSSNPISFYLSVGGMLLFVLLFAVGAGPVPSLLLPEIFPNRIRAKAVAFAMSVHWVFNFLVGLLFLRLLDQLGPATLYSMFCTFCLMAVGFVMRNVLETKGKTLQEIEIALLPQ
ncbi:probable plastidic glucose transporter 2 isoform X3 [Andrographis paniculata]|uniref:probable plastidic glucose transporter 2 isoform X3 n=1 Tax=Andrographis paniculata TaxID=175694 RepID=UPI0021E7A0F8|nr:probable plastidic glucose transporter 2 isoform X3 [Andrographis paniculata]